MQVQEKVPLAPYSTMRLGGSARYLTSVASRQELQEAVAWAQTKQVRMIVIGGGSNLIWTDNGFDGLVVVNKIPGFETLNVDEENLYVTIGAGEEWDEVVKRTVDMGYSGIEQLSLIPGTAGATPIQNVGAYGREISEVLVSVEAYDTQVNTFINIPASECEFGYRTSRFKTTDKGRFYISRITLHLNKTNPLPPYYASVQQYFDEQQISQVTPALLRQAVVTVRTQKLPDPDVIANNGSFFGNPIIDAEEFTQLRDEFPEIVFWEMPDNKVKLSAAWMIERGGFKDFHDHETGMATWDKQPLVLINEHASHTTDLLKFKLKIVDAIKQQFHVTLVQEPEIIT